MRRSSRALGTLAVKLIHEDDQFLQRVAPVEVPMTHSVHPQQGDLWSATVNFKPAARDRRIAARAQGDVRSPRDRIPPVETTCSEVWT